MITVDKINKVLDEAEKIQYRTEDSNQGIAFVLVKALVYSIIYAADLVSKSIKNS